MPRMDIVSNAIPASNIKYLPAPQLELLSKPICSAKTDNPINNDPIDKLLANRIFLISAVIILSLSLQN